MPGSNRFGACTQHREQGAGRSAASPRSLEDKHLPGRHRSNPPAQRGARNVLFPSWVRVLEATFPFSPTGSPTGTSPAPQERSKAALVAQSPQRLLRSLPCSEGWQLDRGGSPRPIFAALLTRHPLCFWPRPGCSAARRAPSCHRPSREWPRPKRACASPQGEPSCRCKTLLITQPQGKCWNGMASGSFALPCATPRGRAGGVPVSCSHRSVPGEQSLAA